MKIVIAGAGDVGFHLAKLLTLEKQDITLIDINEEAVEYARSHIDVMTLRGDSTSLNILREAGVEKSKLFIAVTTSEKTNLVTAILAKKMGAKQTIARVYNPDYLKDDQKTFFAELGVDSLISPSQLAANEIYRLLKQCSVTDIFEFEDGKICMIGINLDDSSPLVNQKLTFLNQNGNNKLSFKTIAVLRGDQTIIPDEKMILRRNDHLYFLTLNKDINPLLQSIGKTVVNVKNVMIMGGTDLGLKTAQILEQEYNVTLVERNKERCKFLVENLHKALVINADSSNVDLLREEGLQKMDAFIALSENSESNIIGSLLAEELGVYKTIAQVSNTDYVRLSQNIGIDTMINENLIAANNIFRFVRKGTVEAIASLQGGFGELIEFSLEKENRLTKKPIKDLHIPKKAMIGGVIRNQESIIPDDDFQLKKHDKVIVFALAEAISSVENIFR